MNRKRPFSRLIAKLPMVISVWAILTFFSCQNKELIQQAELLGQMEAFAEMVSAGVKPIALSAPLAQEEAEGIFQKAEEIATKHGVAVYREADLVQTQLFPTDVAEGKEVFVFYSGNNLEAYLDLKKTVAEGAATEAEARRFGRLLGYPVTHINRLLAKNSDFRTLADFGVSATNLFLYFKDLPRARDFYNRLLGLEIVSDYGFALTLRISEDALVTLVDASVGRHKADEPKTVAIALLTDQLPEWYTYLQTNKVQIKYDYKPKTNNAHDGFVAIDPEGYLLEFETFKQHPENERLMPQLRRFEPLPTQGDSVAAGLGFYGAVTWLYYQDMQAAQLFYEEKMGLELIVDQGWAKVYKVSETGYLGLVDERRGMHRFTEQKGTSISFILKDWEGWYNYVKTKQPLPLIQEKYTGKEGRYEAFVGEDPGKYFLEFNRFSDHPDNKRLLDVIGEK
jgi:catechol 2,3-dioxygenase-like lactoylglutathione lyase family enzyme